MAKKLFVGNLSWGVSNDDLMAAFSEFGSVTEARVMTDRETGRSRGFAFVTFEDDAAADAAVAAMNGKALDNREIVVNEARPQEDRPRREFRPRGANFGSSRGGDYGAPRGGDSYSRY
jgi:cold-inducible RNA-binding protein